MTFDRSAFIKRNTRLAPVPLCPEIKLHLADEAIELWQKTEDEPQGSNSPLPFWAFAWAGGQALARYILDHPHLVAGKTVLDLASGSGLVAIAAAKAGAAHVDANDIDAFAIETIALNAAANGVAINLLDGDITKTEQASKARAWDVVLAGDIAYQRDMAEALTQWLRRQADRGSQVMIGDPGRAYLARESLQSLARYDVPVSKCLEDSDIKVTDVWGLPNK